MGLVIFAVFCFLWWRFGITVACGIMIAVAVLKFW